MSDEQPAPSVIIIGGGIAGLTVGYLLQKGGWKVLLLEAGSRVGGAMHTFVDNGYMAEYGPNTILETSPKISAFIREIGLEEEKRYAEQGASKRFILKNGAPEPLPSSPGGFFFSGYFSWNAKLKLLREPFIKPWGNEYEETLAQFVLRRLGREFLDYAINPFVAGVYAGTPEKLSIRHAFPKLYQLEQQYGSLLKGQVKGARERRKSGETSKQQARMFSFAGGLKTLPEKLADALGERVLLRVKAASLKKSANEWEVCCIDKKGETIFKADKVIYSGTAHQLPELRLKNTDDADFSLFRNIYHPPVSTLTLGFKRSHISHPLDGFGVLVPEAENREILGALFISTLFPERASEGEIALTVFIGGTRHPGNACKTETELMEMALGDLKPMLGIQGNPRFVFHKYWEKAIPQYEVGYGEMKSGFDRLEKDFPGLHFCGNYRDGIAVADTMVQAITTAEKLLAQ